jgi:4-aminobutyrate aminotransferase-like enzyme
MNFKESEKIYRRYQKSVLKIAPFRKPILERGRGNYVLDFDGNKYLDLMAGQFCSVFGHNNKKFNVVVTRQIKKLINTNTLFLTKEVLNAARELSNLTHRQLNKTILLSTGAEAVECALRYAKFYTKKNGVVGIGKGYHGLTLAAQSISSRGKYAKPRIQQSYSIPTPDWLNRPRNVSKARFIAECLRETTRKLNNKKGEIAAIVVEPIISVGGMIFATKEYFKGLQKIAREHKALLIYDECQTGLGRTGKWFGYEHFGVVPDILILAKSCGLGFPVSAVMFKDFIAQEIECRLIHFSSHQNDPLSGAILEFFVQEVKRKRYLKQIQQKGLYLLSKLKQLSRESSWLLNPRGLGLMLGFDLPPERFKPYHNPGQDLISFLEKEGVIIQAVRRGQTFRIIPSYTIAKQDIDFFIKKLKKGLDYLDNTY